MEIKAVLLAFNAFLDMVAGELVILMSNNAAIVAYLKKQRGTVSKALCDRAQEIVLWTEVHSVTQSARYIHGKENVLTDQLSHPDQFLPRSGLSFPECSIALLWTCSPPGQMPSCLSMCLQFQISCSGSRTPSSILWTISTPTTLPLSSYFVKYCLTSDL